MASMTRREALKALGLASLAMTGCASAAGEEDTAAAAGGLSDKCRDVRVKESAAGSPAELRRYEKIVILMMENRSFDHYFGHLSLPRELGGEGRTDIDGFTGGEVQYLTRDGSDGREEFRPFLATEMKIGDIAHDWDSCHAQFNGGAMDGFIQQHYADLQRGKDALCGSHCAALRDPMAYYARKDTPVLHALLDNYTVCDRWFSSVMGPTWPNRCFVHAATSTGHTENKRMKLDKDPATPEKARTIWHELKDKCITAKNYSVDFAWSLGGFGLFNSVPGGSVFKSTAPRSPKDTSPPPTDSFEEECARGTLPTVSMIDPAFIFAPNDDHPPHDIKSGQAFIAAIYKMLTQNEEQWSKTLFIVTYDEHGSFYDHVAPPKIDSDERPEFNQLGFRVPSLVIGPYVKKNYVSKVQYDHVSFLSTVTRRFGLTALNARVSATNDVRDCIDMDALETAGAPSTPIALRSVSLSESQVHESIRYSLGQSELAEIVNGGPATLEQKTRATDQLLAAYDRLGVATIRR